MSGEITVYSAWALARDSHALLARAAMAYTGERVPSLFRVKREGNGKPYFPDCPELHFSISHSGGLWACALGMEQVGLDIQREEETCERGKISRRFFHPDEDAYLSAGDYRDFFKVWAAKESYCKYLGSGITDGFGLFSSVREDQIGPEIEGVKIRFFPLCEGFASCLCAGEIGELRVLRPEEAETWQSP